jgi:hypothetical protein
MGMISRDWACLNLKCRRTFHSFESAPECPACGNARVHWIPGGGHQAKVSPGYDARLRGLADQYGMTNINSPSPSRINRAAPRADHPGPERYRGQHTFAPGFTANIYSKASAEPSLERVNMKGVTASVGDAASPFQRAKTVDPIMSNTTVVARHMGVIPR